MSLYRNRLGQTRSSILDQPFVSMESMILSDPYLRSDGCLFGKEVVVSTEGILSSIGGFFKWIWEKITNLFKRIFGGSGSTSTKEKIKEAKETLEKTKNDLKSGKAVLDPEAVKNTKEKEKGEEAKKKEGVRVIKSPFHDWEKADAYHRFVMIAAASCGVDGDMFGHFGLNKGIIKGSLISGLAIIRELAFKKVQSSVVDFNESIMKLIDAGERGRIEMVEFPDRVAKEIGRVSLAIHNEAASYAQRVGGGDVLFSNDCIIFDPLVEGFSGGIVFGLQSGRNDAKMIMAQSSNSDKLATEIKEHIAKEREKNTKVLESITEDKIKEAEEELFRDTDSYLKALDERIDYLSSLEKEIDDIKSISETWENTLKKRMEETEITSDNEFARVTQEMQMMMIVSIFTLVTKSTPYLDAVSTFYTKAFKAS